ncbi:halocyanin domain-containing protein [Salinirubellus salinus]|uniref:Halocyanin domain-containing protein n=1 Tax=Salinirubellus salinus TaxID=1364945 RepID=A0A9E7UBV2_9EURY|nr:halocyanin domain-containing protein [Salinirubellus salinus]UWM55638.1 halocyanin domain-containing protein [Salinirubellus salinus]
MRRRTYLALAGTLPLTGCLGGGDGGGGESPDDPYGDWFDGVGNYEGETDLTGETAVSVSVGGEDGLAFEPPAIRVTVGTTVTWEWTGRGGLHNVVDEGGAFESELQQEAGTTFEYTFEEVGLYRYFCEPHRSLGMKGGVRAVPE